jgi:hypothetical protein
MNVSGEDFRRVRELPEWPEVAKRLAPTVVRDVPAPAAPPGAGPARADPSRAAPPPTAASPAPVAAPAAPSTALGAADSMRFPAGPFVPTGLAYDAASARFVFSDSLRRKLIVVSEPDGAPQDLVRASSAGFFDVTALEVDHKRGDLWVVSARPAGTPEGPATTALHKLQLVSGRPLDTFSLPSEAGPARLSDIAVAPDGTVLVLDDEGDRVYRLQPRGRALEPVASLAPLAIWRLAPAEARAAYVAHAAGIVRLDLATGKAAPVAFPKDADATNLTWIRSHRGSIVGTQIVVGGCRLIRLRLDGAGRRVRTLEVLDGSISRESCPPATIAGDQVFYMSEGGFDQTGGGPVDIVIRRVPLR